MALLRMIPAVLGALAMLAVTARPTAADDDTYSQDEIVQSASSFFGATSEGVAKVVQHVFSEQGLPDAYIKGDEGSGAVVVGLRYGSGWLIRKGHEPLKVYWQGPSVGWDLGGNASKVFVLVYNLKQEDLLF